MNRKIAHYEDVYNSQRYITPLLKGTNEPHKEYKWIIGGVRRAHPIEATQEHPLDTLNAPILLVRVHQVVDSTCA